MNPGGYVPLTEPGGEAWKYLQSLKLEISKSVDKDDKGAYGIIVKGKVTKSKVCAPYTTFEYYIEFNKGIVYNYELMQLAVEYDIIKKAGAWFSDKDGNKFEGLDGLSMVLIDKDYDGEIFTMEEAVYLKDIETDPKKEDYGVIKVKDLSDKVGIIAIDKHGNESKLIVIGK